MSSGFWATSIDTQLFTHNITNLHTLWACQLNTLCVLASDSSHKPIRTHSDKAVPDTKLRDQSIKGATHPIHTNTSQLTSCLFRPGRSGQDSLFAAIVPQLAFLHLPMDIYMANKLPPSTLALVDTVPPSLALSHATVRSRGSCRNAPATTHMIA